jgi:hypothetical protein
VKAPGLTGKAPGDQVDGVPSGPQSGSPLNQGLWPKFSSITLQEGTFAMAQNSFVGVPTRNLLNAPSSKSNQKIVLL